MVLKSIIEADLHNHTTCSDGSMSPANFIQYARELNLRAAGITDHDTIEGLPEAILAAQETGVELVCGVEVTIRFVEDIFRGSLHLLVYFSSDLLQNQMFTTQFTEALALGRGPALTAARIEAINHEFGPESAEPLLREPLKSEDVYRHGHRISRRHFALSLETAGINDRDTIAHILGNDSPAYIPSGAPMDSLKLVLTAWPVLRILAHPAAGSYPGESHYKEVLPPFETVKALLPKFLDMGLDGLEIYYPGHTPELIEKLELLQHQYNLPVATGGSDCHDASSRPAGVCGVPYSTVEKMKRLMAAKTGGITHENR
jgi:3',5'-nucleoside bisphosphate phosphatase